MQRDDDQLSPFIQAGPDAALGYTIARVAHSVERRVEAQMQAATGLTVRQFGALAHLQRQPGLGSGALARLLLVTAQSAGAMVDGLERHGLLQRDRSGGRGKVAGVRLTPTGSEALSNAYAVAAEIERTLAAALPPGRAATMNRDLLRLHHALTG